MQMLTRFGVLLAVLWGFSPQPEAQAQTVSYSYDLAGRLVRASYGSGQTLVYTYDLAGNVLRQLVTSPQPGPVPTAPNGGVVNAASYKGGAVSPGEIITIFGTGIGPATLAGTALISPGFLESFIGDTLVYFDGIPAPMIYALAGQTSAIVPYAVAGKTSTVMQVEYQGRRSSPVTLSVTSAVPALFSANASGHGPAAALNQDNSLNLPSSPAAKGSVVVLFGTGEGQTTPPGADAKRAVVPLPKPLLPVSATIAGLSAQVLYAGAAPGLVAGVIQLNVRIPANSPSGNVPVVFKVGSASSQANLTVSVQ